MSRVLLFGLLIPRLLLGSPSSLYDTQEYEQAVMEFESLLTQPLSAQERAIVLYNIGTSLLAEGSIDKAIDTFEKIDLHQHSSTLLEQNLNANLALALLKRGEQLSNRTNNYSYEQAMLALYEGRQRIAMAQHAASLLNNLGASSKVLTTLSNIEKQLDKAMGNVIAMQNMYDQNHPFSVPMSMESTVAENAPSSLLTAYREALLQVPLQENAVQALALAAEHLQMGSQFEKEIKNISLLNRLALRFLINRQEVPARLLLMIARTEVQSLLTGFASASADPVEIVQLMIKGQQHALHVNDVSHILALKTLDPLVNDTQERVRHSAKPFIQAVIKRQNQIFDTFSSQEQMTKCHQQWKEALALFYVANNSSSGAVRALANSQPSVASPEQKKALHYLKLTLDKLQQSRKPNPTDSLAKPQEQPQHQNEDNQNIWSLMKQMDAEDRQLGQSTMQATYKEERPW